MYDVRRRTAHIAAHMFFGQMLAMRGWLAEAEPEWRAALDLDPLSPLTHGIVGSGLYFAGRYEDAFARCRRALEIDPNHIQTLFRFSSPGSSRLSETWAARWIA